jgi:hypothetical protein
MIDLKKIGGTVKSFSCKDAPSPAPAKAGGKTTFLHTVKCVIELDVTENMTDVEGLFPMADAAIKLAAGDDMNKGWVQTAKTKPGPMELHLKSGDDDVKVDGVRIQSGVQLHVSAQNQKKTNQGKLVVRVIGRFTDEQLLVIAGCTTHDVKVWLSPSQKSFFDSSGETGKDKGKKSKDADAKSKEAAIVEKLNKPKPAESDDSDMRPTALRAVT